MALSKEEILDAISEMSVMDVVDLVKLMEEKFGVTAAAPVAAAAAPVAGGEAEAAEEQSEFEIFLADVGDKKIDVIKAVRTITGLGLKEAKAIVDGAPSSVKEGAKKASPVLLEPVMKVEAVTPGDYLGDVTGDLNRRRGIIQGMEETVVGNIIKAEVPLSEMFGYVTQLRTITSGRATSSMEFSHYAEAPKNISEDVIAKSKGVVTA